MKNFLSRMVHTKTAHWVTCLVLSGAHIQILYSVQFPPAVVMWLFPLLLVIPGLLTFILVPRSIHKWYRWVILLVLSFIVYPATAPMVLLIGGAWALYMSWFAERPLALKTMFNLRKNETAAKPKPTTVAEVLAAEKAAAFESKKAMTAKQKATADQSTKSATVKASGNK